MAILGGLAAILLAVALWSGWQGADRLRGHNQGTSEVEAAARQFVSAYGTLDFRDPTAYRIRLLALTTGELRKQVQSSGVDPVALGQQQTITTEVVSVDVTAFSDDDATVSATVNQTRRGIDPATNHLREQRLRQHLACRLQEVDGHWLVAAFRLQSEEPLQPTNQ